MFQSLVTASLCLMFLSIGNAVVYDRVGLWTQFFMFLATSVTLGLVYGLVL